MTMGSKRGRGLRSLFILAALSLTAPLTAQTAAVRQTSLAPTALSVLALDAVQTIQALSAGDYELSLSGALNTGTLAKISRPLIANEGVRVSLNLSAVSGLAVIAAGAFADCTNLVSITLPDSTTKVQAAAFSGCTNLAAIVATEASERFSSRDGLLYNKAGDTLLVCPPALHGTVSLESDVSALSPDAFTLSADVSAFTVAAENPAFTARDGCIYSKDLATLVRCAPAREEAVTVAAGVSAIAAHAFDGCTKLTAIVLPASVTEIGELAFANCRALTSLTLPPQLVSIGKQAFFGCAALQELTVPASTTSVGSRAFYHCALTTLAFAQSDGWHYGRKSASDLADSSANPEKFAFPGRYWPYDLYRSNE